MKSDAALILNLLLDRYERSRHYRLPGESARSVSIRCDRTTLPDYWDEHHGERRSELNTATRLLADEGLVTVRLSRYSREEIDRVDLVIEQVAQAYRRADRLPRRELDERLSGAAASWADCWPECDWRRTFARAVAESAAAFDRPPAGFKPGEEKLLTDICRTLDGLGATGLPAELPRRLFSSRTLGDSKRLEAIQGRLVRVLREFCPSALPETDREVLAEFGIVENPQHVFVAGPVTLDEVPVAATGAGLGLPASFVDRCRVTALAADRVITVENLTSYYQVVDNLPHRTLAVYPGGYHNRARRQLLLKLATAGCREFFHWGDIDLGGFRIFVHLKERTGLPLRPLLMDLATYRSHQAAGLPFSDGYAGELAALLAQQPFEPFWPVIAQMLKERTRVEQESLDFSWPDGD